MARKRENGEHGEDGSGAEGASTDSPEQEREPEAATSGASATDPNAELNRRIEQTREKARKAREVAQRAVAEADEAEHQLAVATAKPSNVPPSETGWYVVKKEFHGTSPHLQKHGVGSIHLVVGQRVHRKHHPLKVWVAAGLQVEAA
jgi:hypothetical protein